MVSCKKKRKWETRIEAHKAMKRTMRDPKTWGVLHAYECPDCGGWHVGHLKESDWQRKPVAPVGKG